MPNEKFETSASPAPPRGLGRLLGSLNGADEIAPGAQSDTLDEAREPVSPAQTPGQSPGQALAAGQMFRRTSGGAGAPLGEIRDELEGNRAELREVRCMVARLLDRKPVDQNVFDTLHLELKDYKNDFFYERLKPIVRPLLFALDSVEEFQAQLETRGATGLAKDAETLQITSDYLGHFIAQLQDVLGLCEAFPIENCATFDASIHRAVETVRVSPEAADSVQAVKRTGWTLGGAVLRPTEVVRGVG